MKAFIVFFIAIVAVANAYTLTRKTNSTEFGTPGLVAIVDGKRYYAEDYPRMNWTDANSYCESWGLTLAEIRTEAERNALADAAGLPGFDAYFWTSGRDSQSHSQFVWDRSGAQVPSYITFRHFEDIRTCVVLTTNSRNDVSFHSYNCGNLSGKLCQT